MHADFSHTPEYSCLKTLFEVSEMAALLNANNGRSRRARLFVVVRTAVSVQSPSCFLHPRLNERLLMMHHTQSFV